MDIFVWKAAATWPMRFEECNGSMQSPINIWRKNLKNKETEVPLTWINYSTAPKTMVIENSRYSIHGTSVWEKTADIPHITNGPLEHRFFFSQFHFHWGKDSTKGSEHTIDNKRYPMEMHIVHDRLNSEDSYTQEDNSTQLVVVTFLFKISQQSNPGMNDFLSHIKHVEGSREKKTLAKPFSLDRIINTFSDDYVTYMGSLTTPPCTEGVLWIISLKTLDISEMQMIRLRKSVRNHRGMPIQNFRPLQALNGRDVFIVKKS